MYVFLMIAAFCINAVHALCLMFPYASNDAFDALLLITFAVLAGFTSAFFITETVARYMRWER